MTLITGFMGSPRKGGNTDILLDALLVEAAAHGAVTEGISIAGRDITPCIECGGCDETGVCVLSDGMTPLYEKIEASDVVVLASPIFFYNITASTQALVERSQACWTGKYRLKRGPLGGKMRKGVFLSLGATQGKLLFDGVLRVVRYFFDAIDATFECALLYRGIEKRGAILEHPTAIKEARTLGAFLAEGKDLSGVEGLVRP